MVKTKIWPAAASREKLVVQLKLPHVKFGPNYFLLISLGASSAHNCNASGWVLPLCIYPQPVFMKEVNKHDARRISYYYLLL